MTRRPLLSLTSGDLGTTARNLEVRLDKYLRLGERWGAIVLIDEADVYLERREKTDIKRNSLVSGKKTERLGTTTLTLASFVESPRILPRNFVPYNQPHRRV